MHQTACKSHSNDSGARRCEGACRTAAIPNFTSGDGTQMDSLRGLAEAFLKGLLHLITQLYPNPLILRRMRGT